MNYHGYLNAGRRHRHVLRAPLPSVGRRAQHAFRGDVRDRGRRRCGAAHESLPAVARPGRPRRRPLAAASAGRAALRGRLRPRLDLARDDPLLLRRLLRRRVVHLHPPHPLAGGHRRGQCPRRRCGPVVGVRAVRRRTRRDMAARLVGAEPAEPLLRHDPERHASPLPVARVPVRGHGDRPAAAGDRSVAVATRRPRRRVPGRWLRAELDRHETRRRRLDRRRPRSTCSGQPIRSTEVSCTRSSHSAAR